MCVTNGDPQCTEACAGSPGPGAGGSGPGVGGGPATGGTGAVSAGGSAGAGAAPGAGGGAGVGAGGSGVGGSTGGSGPAACGDAYCDFFAFEDCATCPGDCPCGSGGAGGSSTGGSGAGGSGAGGSGAGGTGPAPVDPAALDRAKAGVGFSYWWGHGRYRPEGPDSSTAGSCSGGCPSCTHSGSYGGDCSGFVAKVWQVPSSNDDLTVDSHPYSTANFYEDTSQWSTIPQGDMKALDAMVYRSGGAGHIFIYDHGDPWGSMFAYECKGCSYGCTGGMRTASSSYHSIRRAGY
jgi:hypothetical protein